MTGCVVDAKQEVFQCVQYPNQRSVVPFAQGGLLECVSPPDFEAALKACQNHQVLEVTRCQIQTADRHFACHTPQAEWFFLDYAGVDNYFCLSGQDYRRIIERCKTAGI